MKPFKNATDVKRRNKQAFKILKELEEYTVVLRPMMYYSHEYFNIQLSNQSPLTLKVKFEGTQ